MVLRECSGVVRSTKVCGPMLRLALENYSVVLTECFSLGNKIFLVEEKRTCFQLKVGLSTEAASFLVAWRLLPRRLLQTIC